MDTGTQDPRVQVVRAAAEMVAARTRLRDAMHAADRAALGRNEIARAAYPAMSRGTVLSVLAALDLHARAQAALAGPLQREDVEIRTYRSGNTVRIVLAARLLEDWQHNRSARFSVAGAVLAQLPRAGLTARHPDRTRTDSPRAALALGAELDLALRQR